MLAMLAYMKTSMCGATLVNGRQTRRHLHGVRVHVFAR